MRGAFSRRLGDDVNAGRGNIFGICQFQTRRAAVEQHRKEFGELDANRFERLFKFAMHNLVEFRNRLVQTFNRVRGVGGLLGEKRVPRF